MNIVLIGIMGAGKTTVGQALARRIGYAYVDMDEYIEKKEGKTISQLFEPGEEHFRRIETAAADALGKLEKTVIATGGGVVKNPANVETLAEQGIVVYLQRDPARILEVLDVSNRPLLRDNPSHLYTIARERAPLYEEAAHLCVENNGDEEETVDRLIEELKKRWKLAVEEGKEA